METAFWIGKAVILAGALTVAFPANAEPYFNAFVPATATWQINAVGGYSPKQYDSLVAFLGGPDPETIAPPTTYLLPDDRTVSGWGMRSFPDAASLNAFTASINAGLEAADISAVDYGGLWGASFKGEKNVLQLSTGDEAQIIGGITLADLVRGSVFASTSDESIDAAFRPNFGLTMAQADRICGCVFDWQQKVTVPDPSPFFARREDTPGGPMHFTAADGPMLDPPPGGGWTYARRDDSYPFYWDMGPELADNTRSDSLLFHDAPADPCLGDGFAGKMGCGGMLAPAGASMGFQTRLVAVYPSGAYEDTGVGFDWRSDFNGIVGGAAIDATFKTYPGTTYGKGLGGAFLDRMLEDPDMRPAAAPEPNTVALLACGLAFLGWRWRR